MTSETISKPRTTTKAPNAAQALIVRTVAASELASYVSEWEALAGRALTPNPFHEPWMLLPAIEHLRGSSHLEFLLVFGAGARGTSEPVLLGLFPLEVESRCLHLPIRTLSLWQHKYCFLNVPLIDRDHAWPVLEAFWRWWETGPFGCRVLDTKLFLAEGRFHEIWSDFAIGRVSLMLNEYARAALHPAGTADSYTSAAVSKKHLQEYARLERKLNQMGPCEYREVKDEGDVEGWLDEFLRVESSGWKGAKGGGAFASNEEDVRFLRAVTRDGFAGNRVMLLRFDLNGAPIALKYNLCSGAGGFAFKIAFDEEFSKYCPGVLLELENVRRVFDRDRMEWMDSCAAARHPMADRLWSERRMIRRTLYSNGSRAGDLIVSSLPLLRWFNDRIRLRPVPINRRISTTGA